MRASAAAKRSNGQIQKRQLQIKVFLAECTFRSRGHRIQASRLYAAYRAWAMTNDQQPMMMSGVLFSREMRRLPDQNKIKANVSWWLDLSLVAGGSQPSGLLEEAWLATSRDEALAFLQSKLDQLGIGK